MRGKVPHPNRHRVCPGCARNRATAWQESAATDPHPRTELCWSCEWKQKHHTAKGLTKADCADLDRIFAIL